MLDIKTYIPAGETLRRFHQSAKFFRAVCGPVGSGKTAAAGCAEMVLGCMVQNPFPDGVRRAKFGVLRDSYRNLYSQFLPSWFEWFPRELGKFTGSDDRPAMHTFTADTPIGPCEIQVEMRALGTNSVEATCRGWNLTGCFIDELDLLPREALGFLSGRVKRWPQRPYRVSKGVWGVFNKPDEDHWLHDMCVDDPPPDFEFFDQPPGVRRGDPPSVLNPLAENLERLDPDYYEVQIENNRHDQGYAHRMVYNEWGASRAGQLIYPGFSSLVHVSPVELEPPPGTILRLGLDGGGTPAAVIGGRNPYGQLVIYAEVVIEDPLDTKHRTLKRQVGGRRFGEALRDALQPRFRHCKVELGWGDMSAWYGVDREMGEYSDMETAGQVAGIALIPSESNEIALRLDAVRDRLSTPGGSTRPNMIINPSCRWVRRGFVTDYRWEDEKKKAAGETLKPVKSATSHVHDALQYLCLGEVGRAGVTGGQKFDRWQGQPDAPSSKLWREHEVRVVARGAGQSYGGADFDLWRS